MRNLSISQVKLPPAIFLMGPTASGKTGLAVELAQRLPLELISVDSALIYRGMDIGTAKPDAALLRRARHNLIDVIEPTQSYSAARFRTDASMLMAEITARGNIPLLVGGTMLYFNALQHGLDELPQADPGLRTELLERAQRLGWPAMHAELAHIDPLTAARLEANDAQRIERALEICKISGRPMSALLGEQEKIGLPYRLLKLALLPSERATLHQRIATRFDQMMQQGLLQELAQLRTRHAELHPGLPAMRCVGYRQAWQYQAGEIDLPTLREKAIAATRQLAKRQMTWLRGMGDVEVLDCLQADLTEALEKRLREFVGE